MSAFSPATDRTARCARRETPSRAPEGLRGGPGTEGSCAWKSYSQERVAALGVKRSGVGRAQWIRPRGLATPRHGKRIWASCALRAGRAGAIGRTDALGRASRCVVVAVVGRVVVARRGARVRSVVPMVAAAQDAVAFRRGPATQFSGEPHATSRARVFGARSVDRAVVPSRRRAGQGRGQHSAKTNPIFLPAPADRLRRRVRTPLGFPPRHGAKVVARWVKWQKTMGEVAKESGSDAPAGASSSVAVTNFARAAY